MWIEVTMQSKKYVDLWLDMWLLFISQPSVTFDSGWFRESESIKFFIFYMTLYDHFINRLCDLMTNRPALKPKTLASLLAMVSRKLKYNAFPLGSDNLIMWSKRQKTQWMVNLYYKHPLYQVWQSKASWEWIYIVFY